MIKKLSKLILLTLLVELVFSSTNYGPLKGIIAIMVEFQQEIEDDVLTSGDGTFLDELNVSYIEHADIDRCNPDDAFIVDPPPHDYQYFSDQLTAVKNYYNNISNIDFQTILINEVYTLPKKMSEYAKSDEDITKLFVKAVKLAKHDIIANIDNSWTEEDFIVVVFHAG